MTNNYQIEDFAEFEQILKSKGDLIASLVENLNSIISTNNEVCDMYICMNYFSKYKNIYTHIQRILKSDIGKLIYIYFKFLLLDDEVKENVYNKFILRISNLLHYFLTKQYSEHKLFYNTNDENFDKLTLIDMMSEIYDIHNDDTLLNFMDYTNAYNEYVRLDIEKLQNIDYRNDFYVTEQFYEKFTFIVWMFDTIPFTYNFVYYMSNTPEYQSMLREGETSIQSKEDFMRRFQSNTDKFIRFYNYIQNDGDICIPIQDYDKISTDKIILNRNPDILLTNENKTQFVNDLICIIFESPFTTYRDFYNSLKKVLIKFNYNNLYPNNEYKMMIKDEIDLKKRYKSYFKSKLYVNLDFINFIHDKYKHIVELKELTDYLEEIIKKHHFNKIIKY